MQGCRMVLGTCWCNMLDIDRTDGDHGNLLHECAHESPKEAITVHDVTRPHRNLAGNLVAIIIDLKDPEVGVLIFVVLSPT